MESTGDSGMECEERVEANRRELKGGIEDKVDKVKVGVHEQRANTER
jgi:hypothetical protein